MTVADNEGPVRQLDHAARDQSGSARTAPLDDARIVALARAACAPHGPLRRPFLRGRWRHAHIDRVAAAAADLAARRSEIAPDGVADTTRRIAARLRQLLQQARPVAEGLNGLAEFLGGRAARHRDRLVALPATPAASRAPDATGPALAAGPVGQSLRQAGSAAERTKRTEP